MASEEEKSINISALFAKALISSSRAGMLFFLTPPIKMRLLSLTISSERRDPMRPDIPTIPIERAITSFGLQKGLKISKILYFFKLGCNLKFYLRKADIRDPIFY